MTDIITEAIASTAQIIANVDNARLLLSPSLEPRINAAGVLASPAGYLSALRAAADEINDAIQIHRETRWPSDVDYRVL